MWIISRQRWFLLFYHKYNFPLSFLYGYCVSLSMYNTFIINKISYLCSLKDHIVDMKK